MRGRLLYTSLAAGLIAIDGPTITFLSAAGLEGLACGMKPSEP